MKFSARKGEQAEVMKKDLVEKFKRAIPSGVSVEEEESSSYSSFPSYAHAEF